MRKIRVRHPEAPDGGRHTRGPCAVSARCENLAHTLTSLAADRQEGPAGRIVGQEGTGVAVSLSSMRGGTRTACARFSARGTRRW